jgi:hypothetical protein
VGLSLPASVFLRGLLLYYELELHHLTSGEVLHVAAFVMLCEALLGILPHFPLWRYFFHIHAVDDPLPLISGAALQSCQGSVGHYVWLLMAPASKGWQGQWFPVWNRAPSLLMFIGAPPVRQESWDWGPDNTEKKKKLEGVLSQVHSLIAEGLTGELSLETFFTWRNRPLRACAHGI